MILDVRHTRASRKKDQQSRLALSRACMHDWFVAIIRKRTRIRKR